MLATTKRFYTKMVSFLTAMVITITTAVFTVATASATSISDGEMNEMINELAVLVNEEREKEGLKPLYVVPYLNECAKIRALEVTGDDEDFSHTRPDGTGYQTVIDENIIAWGKVSENLAAGSNSATGALEQWKNSPKHWANIMNPKVTHIGIAVNYDPDSAYKWYWTQIFTADLYDPNAEYEGQYLPAKFAVVPADEGDVNGDARVDTFDYITLVEYIRKKKAGEPVYFNSAQLEAADCFKDGIISEADAKCMVRYILGEYDSLPFEF